MSFQGYLKTIKEKTGNGPAEFRTLAEQKGFTANGELKAEVKAGDIVNWLKNDFELGRVQFVQVEENLWVANLIGQHKINKDENGDAPIRYNAIEKGLEAVSDFAKTNNASVHMPRIGCGLAGENGK